MKCYVKFLDCKNNFKETSKDFETPELAWEWILKTFDKTSKDYIHYY